MPFRLRWNDVRFGDLLVDQADHLVSGAQHLAEALGGDQSARLQAAQRLQEVDHKAEAASHAVLRALSAAFVTPFDRTDVYRVAWGMRRCVARMDAVADEIVLFQLGELPEGVTELVNLVARSSDVSREAVPALVRPRGLSDSWIELTRLAKQAGREHRRLLSQVTSLSTDVAVLVRLASLAQSLRRVVEAFEDLADALQTVAVKEA